MTIRLSGERDEASVVDERDTASESTIGFVEYR